MSDATGYTVTVAFLGIEMESALWIALAASPVAPQVRDAEGASFGWGGQVVGPGRSERIRTSGPCVPNTVLYQAELHSGQRRSVTRASEAGI